MGRERRRNRWGQGRERTGKLSQGDDREIPKEIPREIKVMRAKQRHPVNGSRKSKDEYPECKICTHMAPMTVPK